MSVARHSLYNLLGAALPMVLSLVTVPLYLRAIGLDRFGVISICWLLVGYFGLFELGLGAAASQHLAAQRDGANGERGRLLAAALVLSASVGLMGALLLYFVGEWALLSLEGVDAFFGVEIEQGLAWLALCMPLVTVSSVLGGVLQSQRRFLAMNLIALTSNVLITVIPLVTAIYWSPRIPALIGSVVASRLLVLVIYIITCHTDPVDRLRKPRISTIKGLLKFGGWLSVSTFVTQVLMSAEKFLIGYRLGSSSVSTYVIPYSLLSRLLTVPLSLGSAMFPVMASRDKPGTDELELQALKVLTAIFTPITIGMIAVLPVFLRLWVGPQLAAASSPIAVIIMAGIWLNVNSHATVARLNGAGRPEIVARLNLVQILPYLVIVWVFVAKWGLIGAAAAWSLRVSVESFVFYALGRNFGAYLRTILPRVPLIAISMVVGVSTPANSVVRWIGMAALLAIAARTSYPAIIHLLPSSLRNRLSGALTLRA